MKFGRRRSRAEFCRVKCPESLKAALKEFKSPKELVATAALGYHTAKRLLENPDGLFAYGTITKLYQVVGLRRSWKLAHGVEYVMDSPNARLAYTQLVNKVTKAWCAVADIVRATKRSAFRFSPTHKDLVNAVAALEAAGKYIWKVHGQHPEYDVVLFDDDNEFVKQWKKQHEGEDLTTGKKVRKGCWEPFRVYSENKDLNVYRAHNDDAGWDLRLADDEVTVLPNQSVTVHTGLHFAIPRYHVGLIKSRSGLSTAHGIEVGAGVIDCGYRGPVCVVLHNLGTESVTFKRGDRIAQLVLCRIFVGACHSVDTLEELGEGDRNADGFGSSGIE